MVSIPRSSPIHSGMPVKIENIKVDDTIECQPGQCHHHNCRGCQRIVCYWTNATTGIRNDAASAKANPSDGLTPL